jgi:hypothetical protein
MNGFKRLLFGIVMALFVSTMTGCISSRITADVVTSIAAKADPDLKAAVALGTDALGANDNLVICDQALSEVTAAFEIADRPVPDSIKNQVHMFYDIMKLRIIQQTVKKVADTVNQQCKEFANEVMMAIATRGRSAGPTFTTPTAPLDINITAKPAKASASADASFSFASSTPGSTECKLDNGKFAACVSPQAYTGLADGPHKFSVRSSDAAGDTGPTQTYNWTVKLAPVVPPVVPVAPPA